MSLLTRTRSRLAALLAVALVMISSVVVASPAAAGPGDPLYLSVTKTVDNATPDPGESFVYTIRVTCSEASCLDARFTDPLPAELDGYELVSANFSPSATSIPRTIQWIVDGNSSASAPPVVTADTTLNVDFTGAVTAPSGTGLQNGQTFTVLLTLTVPTDLPPGTTVITNTASTTATNSSDSSDSAVITVTMPQSIGVVAAKTWTPSTQTFQVGAASTISLGATSESNVTLDSLVIQEPQAAAPGASALDASNPFTLKDFDGFASLTMPSGATTVQVDAYLFQAGSWQWVTGTPDTVAALPGGVSDADVGGLRFTFGGGAIAADATAGVTIDLAQRANSRTGTDLSTASHTVTNTVLARATATGLDPVTDTATADHTVNPARVAAATSKDISPDRIAAGDTSVATIVATNDSDVPVAELRVEDLDYFTTDITFGGFEAGIAWPAGTDTATVVYHPLSGGADEVVAFADGATPAAPSAPISGFDVIFTAASGTIAAGESATIEFGIDTTEASLGSNASLTTTNEVTATVTALNGVTDDAQASDSLVLLRPAIDVTFTKTLLPATQARPGDRVVAELEARMTTTSDYVIAETITVEDSWSGEGTFWDAFTLDSFPMTQVPANSTLEIEVLGANHTTWLALQEFADNPTPYLAGMTAGDLASQINARSGGTWTAADVTGVRFTYISVDPAGFAGDTTVTPYVSATARATLRDSGQPISPDSDTALNYTNTASAGGEGETRTGTPLSDTAGDTGIAAVASSDGSGAAGIGKAWDVITVPAQSDAERSTTLTWTVDDGFETVTIADAEDPTDPEGTVYGAFNLTAIEPIASSSTPFSNGWFMRYDTIAAIELWTGSAWVEVTEPVGGWVNNGAFVGYTLSASEAANTTGVRIVLEENFASRIAAQAGGTYDPYAPAVGSGVASSASDREFELTWTLRDKTRVSDQWVTDALTYNNVSAGVVDNTATLAATPIGGGADVTSAATDSIVITNPGPGVTVSKAVSPTTPMYVPLEGTAAASYPTAVFTVTARSNSVSAASYVRVMDSPVCSDTAPIVDCESPGTAAGALADPFTGGFEPLGVTGMGNPFDRFNLTDVTISASIPAQVDLDESTVWLLHYNAGVYSTTSHAATDVNAMTAGALEDVVAVSVTFQDTDPANDGGSITSTNTLTLRLNVQLRTHYRVSGEPQTLAANNTVNVPNRAFAQSYDPIVNDGVQTGALAAVNARLTGGDINVAVTKAISPAALTEPTRHDPVTVTLGATPGTSPVSSLGSAQVRLTDDVTTSPDFWNAFNFTGLGTITAPAGSDQVEVAVYGPFGAGGSMAWVTGAPTSAASATVPVAAGSYSQIQGLRLTFSRADGGFFSNSMPAATWTTSSTYTAVLRDTFRSGGAPIEMTGSVPTAVTAISDRLNGEASPLRSASTVIALSSGTFEIEVNKLANEGTRTASAGTSVPWDLTFTNSGTGYLTITELRDTLPTWLVYLGDTAPVYTLDSGGLLPEPSSVSVVGNEVVFTWPAGDRTMAPGETFAVRIMLELQPGLSSGDRATNEMTVATVETLASCANINSGGSTTTAWSSDPTTCGTTDYVSPSAGPNLFTVKGVRGSVDGASNPSNPDQECTASLNATGGAYFRAPCAANSVIGGSDEWVLRAQNAGTTGLEEMVIFDALPAPDDTYLISGLDRGSHYRPQMLDDLDITAPSGTDITIEVTQTPQACAGTWAGLESQAVCEQNGETWAVADAFTDWSQVTAFRLTVSFVSTTAGMLSPGEFVDVTFSTSNVPASASNPAGAPVEVPVTQAFAWNQFGVKYLDTGASAYRKIAPARMGIQLPVGSLTLRKVVAGAYANEAPSSYSVNLQCSVAGAPLVMGAYGTVTLAQATAYEQTVSGLPQGSACDVTEADAKGATSVTFAGTDVVTLSGNSARVTVGSSIQVFTVTNHFASTLALTGATAWGSVLGLASTTVLVGVGLVVWSRRRLAA